MSPQSRLLDPDLGGGGILDVGCYTVSAARLVAGTAAGKPFDNPVSVTGEARIGKTGVDEEARATLTFPSGIVAEVACAVRANLGTRLQVEGSQGTLSMENPWAAHGHKPVDGLIELKKGNAVESIKVPCHSTSYTLEAEAVAIAILAGKKEPDPPAMTWADSLGNLETLDAWRKEVGLPRTAADAFLSSRCRPGN